MQDHRLDRRNDLRTAVPGRFIPRHGVWRKACFSKSWRVSRRYPGFLSDTSIRRSCFCAALQFGAAIPLGIFTATIVSRLRFLGVRAAGTEIAFFGGLATALNMMASSSVLWTMSYPGIAQEPALLQALYRLTFALGGRGFSVPFGLAHCGRFGDSGFQELLPKWIVILGVVVALLGELSWLDILFPKVLFLIPLTRFPGYVWLIAAGFALPNTVGHERHEQK